MSVIVLRLANFQAGIEEDRPVQCPNCESDLLQRWGMGSKNVQDANREVSSFFRYHCSACGRTFRNYPHGISRAKLTFRIRKLAALCWALGLSAREVVQIFKDLGIELSHMTVWRDGHEFIDSWSRDSDSNHDFKYLIEKLCLKTKGRVIGTSIVLDLGEGKAAVLGKINERNPSLVSTWLEPFFKDIDIQVTLLGTDILQHSEMV
jgi:DNA-directed RNA polymerase subunit RPC12/RpoP